MKEIPKHVIDNYNHKSLMEKKAIVTEKSRKRHLERNENKADDVVLLIYTNWSKIERFITQTTMAEFIDKIIALNFMKPVKNKHTSKSIEFIEVKNETKTSIEDIITKKDYYKLNDLFNAEDSYSS